MTTFQYIKVLITDALSIASTCMSIYKLCTSQTMDNLELSGFNGSLYTYPSLPVAVIGLWILVASRTKRLSLADVVSSEVVSNLESMSYIESVIVSHL